MKFLGPSSLGIPDPPGRIRRTDSAATDEIGAAVQSNQTTTATASRVTSGQKRSALSTAAEGQGAVLALPLCLEGLVFSPLAAADHPGCRNLSAPG
jgi:hypothetical protein